MNKNIIKWIAGGIVIFLVIILFASKNYQTASGSIKIGVITPLSGSMSYWGLPSTNGMKLAVEEINNAGGISNKKLELVVEDSKGDVAEGANAANKLINIDKVFTIITDLTSVSNAVLPFTEKAQMPAIFNAADSNIALQSKFAFKTFYDAKKECKNLADYAVNVMGMKKIGLLLPTTMPYSQTCISGVKEVTSNTVDLSYQFLSGDYKTILLKAKQAKVDGMVWLGFPFETDVLNKQKQELGIKIPLLCGYKEECISDTAKKTVSNDYLNGTISFDFQDISSSAFGKKYLALYPDTSTEDIVPVAFGYDEVMTIASALKKDSNLDKTTFFEELKNVKNYSTAIGSSGFDSNRILNINTRLLKYNNGNWDLITK